MPAPSVVLTRGPITLTMQPIELRGFRISGSIGQSAIAGEWTLSVSTQMIDPSVVAPNDQSWRASRSETKPFNEAPSEAAVTARLQQLVDDVYDSVPTP